MAKAFAAQVIIVFLQMQTPCPNDTKHYSIQSKAKGACKKA
jgi:hypothetical protein